MLVIRRYSICRLMLLVLMIPISSQAEERTFKVVVSIKPVHSILASLMKGGDEPILLVSGSGSPFEHQLTDSQKKQIVDADMLVWTGPELEAFMIEAVEELSGKTKVVELLDQTALKILPHCCKENARDPFFWMDSRNILILTDELARMLMDANPARAHLYQRNRRELNAKLAEIDRRYEYGYRGLSQGVVLLYYDSLQYFSQAYAMRLGDVLSQLPPAPVPAEKLLQARSNISNGSVQCVLTEAGMPANHLSLLTNGLSVNIGELDSFGRRFQPGPELYAQMMDYNTGVINTCLGRKGQPKNVYLDSGGTAPGETIGGPFMLTDHFGRLVTDKDLLGNYHILFFGYTYCPDICPISLQVLARALKVLGDEGNRFVPWFISVDPERDKAEKLREYVNYFGQNMVGLTGSISMIERVAKQYKVRYEKVMEEGGDPMLYTMDHSASLFLIGPDGRFITKFANGITPQALADGLQEYR
ncbi:metal ABC transporter solute-binding protein, Zn/Mn family [Sedimenticola selenatireducens]|uniref:metal ABC transporter solute-binding protein, Zn/Mn family n=1 Tax=Sedimenticola selenatireducens TaxID=191960 RepID=UPI00146FA159|nr:SCO family protein [Sedimenticola selenatireducens]